MSMQILQVKSLMPGLLQEDFLYSEVVAHSSHLHGFPKGRLRLQDPQLKVR